jgi:hypothetical protein
MRRILPYRSKPIKAEPTPEARRKASRCFIGAGLLALAGLALIILGFGIGAEWFASSSAHGRGRGAASFCLLGLMVIGLAIRVLNAGFYHRSGFETRHGHGDR